VTLNFDEIIPMSILHFYQMKVQGFYFQKSKKQFLNDKYLFPNTANFLKQKEFAECYFAWDEEGLYFQFNVEMIGDIKDLALKNMGSIEIMIDTRDNKELSYLNEYCHHFLISPDESFKTSAKEITKFRSMSIHKLCDPKHLKTEIDITSKMYQINLIIPTQCLHGYDPSYCQTLGFTYKINRPGSVSQVFGMQQMEYEIEKNPRFWPSIQLIK